MISLLSLVRLDEAKGLTDTEVQDLHHLQHSKDHLGVEWGKRVPAIDRALQLFGKPTPIPLYRGLPPEAKSEVRGSFVRASGYCSFTENFSIGSTFAADSGVLLELNGSRRGFCYYEWLESEYRALSPEEFEQADGEWAIEAARSEAEWIMPFDSVFRIVGRRSHGGIRMLVVV